MLIEALTNHFQSYFDRAKHHDLADDLQVRYDLTRWAVGLPHGVGLTLRSTFANVQDALWTYVEESLTGLETEDEWWTWLDAHDGPIGARADDCWAREGGVLSLSKGRDPGWKLLVLARDLLTAIHGLRRELDRWTRPADALRRYAGGLYCIDQEPPPA